MYYSYFLHIYGLWVTLWCHARTHTDTHGQDLMIYKREQWSGKDCCALKWWLDGLSGKPPKDKCAPLCSASIPPLPSVCLDSVSDHTHTLKWCCTLSPWILVQTFAHHIQPLTSIRAHWALPHFVLRWPLYKAAEVECLSPGLLLTRRGFSRDSRGPNQSNMLVTWAAWTSHLNEITD